MRACYVPLLALLASTAHAQTVNTVQDGAWNAPGTWSCNCVPGATASVVVMHSVQLLGDLTLTGPQLQVTSTGEITTSFPVTLTLSGVCIIEGHVFISGWVNNIGLLDITGLFEVAGDFTSDGQVLIDGGTLIVEGDFTNYSTITGDGSICVGDSTVNQGTISGPLDLCDQSPTVSSPPFLDENTGEVENTVTFCTNSACVVGIADHFASAISIAPNPANESVQLVGLATGDLISVIDATGRTCMLKRSTSDRTHMDVSALSVGSYRIRVGPGTGVRVLPLLIVR